MAPNAPHDQAALLDEVLERIADTPEASSLLTGFARTYLHRLPPDLAISPDALHHEIVGLYDLIETRTEPITVRAFNPTVDSHGYESGTVVEINVDDSPFLVDSVVNELQAHGLEVERIMHPVIGTTRDGDGRLLELTPARSSSTRESTQHVVLDRVLFEADLPGLERALHGTLGDVRRTVDDFEAMLDRIPRMVELARTGEGHYPDTEIDETIAFLEWLREDNFVFLGYREYRIDDSPQGAVVQTVADSGLGILSDPTRSRVAEPVLVSSLPPELAARYEKGDLLVLSKTNQATTVHRRAKMDYLGVRIVGEGGETIGEARLLGLFTSKAYMEPPSRTPVLRRKLDAILAAEDLIEGSHDHKALIALFEDYPKDELLSVPTEDLRQVLVGLLTLQERAHVRLFIRRDLLDRSVRVLVAMPRDRYSATLRRQLQELFLLNFRGTSVDYHLTLGEADPAQLHFRVWIEEGQLPDVSYEELDTEVRELTRSWPERVAAVLATRHGEEGGRRLADRWASRFPTHYTSATALEIAAGDIERLEELMEGSQRALVGLQNDPTGPEMLTRVTLYRRDGKRPLSELVPALEDIGVRVFEEAPTRLGDDGDLFIHDFGVLSSAGELLDLETHRQRVADALSAAWDGDTESDTLNRLILVAGLDHHQVDIVRAYQTYWRRVSPVFTTNYVNDTLVAHPEITARLVRLFELRFAPDSAGEGFAELREEVVAMLDLVPSLEQDRILRSFLRLIEATVRTNAYLPQRRCLAFKLSSADVPDMPPPPPHREIFVIAPDVEGIHLRAGAVARGGIRWSDRREDYRTEVLGLMKGQITKNAVIVPTGAKGGFVLRRLPDDPGAVREAVLSAYVTFVHGLLDVTDNLVDGEVVHPPAVRVHDGDDPYMVVAADKGTAAFSDVANRIAAEHGFWLDDAFASGGSSGYDHKALGITARGAWQSLERHFLELGIDPHRDTFTVVGIGDMSGDVFGNGMLGSPTLQLVAAFDHRHIFVDPDPDPAVSFDERRRLFQLPASTWLDYDSELISEGGGVFPRIAKKVILSPQVRERLGTDAEVATPAELIRIILRAPVDLLWSGGVGTYVKATDESHEEAADRANDARRVNGAELRSRVVVEGGNLALTQRGRIEYAASGGRVNTDFIDNSGGVNCSDREVNLKILLRLAERRGDIERVERDQLMSAAAEGVVEQILHDSAEQVQMLTLEEQASPHRMDAYEQLITRLEEEKALDRELTGLPSTEEMAERSRSGMSRPELAVLLTYAKASLVDALLASDLPDSPHLVEDLAGYFPAEVALRFADLLAEHPLRRELIATVVANDVINTQGSTFVSRLVARTGAEPDDVVWAHRMAVGATAGTERRHSLEKLFGSIDPEMWVKLMRAHDRLVGNLTRWYLRRDAKLADAAEIDRSAHDFAALEEAVAELGPPDWQAEREMRLGEMTAAGVPPELARRVVFAPDLTHAPDIIDLTRLTGRPVTDVGRVFFLVGRALRLDTLGEIVRMMTISNPWQRWARQTLEDELVTVRRQLAEQVLAEAGAAPADKAVDTFLARRERQVARVVGLVDRIESAAGEDLAPLMVAVRQLQALAT